MDDIISPVNLPYAIYGLLALIIAFILLMKLTDWIDKVQGNEW